MSVMASDDENDDETTYTGPSLVTPAQSLDEKRAEEQEKRRAEIYSLTLAGYTQEQIAERFKVSQMEISHTLQRMFDSSPETTVQQMRTIENARIDRAQQSIWTDVLRGDHKAIATFIRLSERRSRINGMDAPVKMDLTVGIRQEMMEQLDQFEAMVMGDIVEGQVVEDDTGYAGDAGESDPGTVG